MCLAFSSALMLAHCAVGRRIVCSDLSFGTAQGYADFIGMHSPLSDADAAAELSVVAETRTAIITREFYSL
jgi:hypothetical protein